MVPSGKVLERWVKARGALRGAVSVPVRWGDRPGTAYAAGPGRHALALEGEAVRFDPGPGQDDPLAPFWRALDLLCVPSARELGAALEAAGIDLLRSGYARAPRSGDGVALTVGARGEGESALPQLHFARSPLRLLAVRLPGSGETRLGDPGPQGWPAWFDLGETGRLEVVGAPVPAPTAPPWAVRPPAPGGPESPLPDWRRAFEGPRP